MKPVVVETEKAKHAVNTRGPAPRYSSRAGLGIAKSEVLKPKTVAGGSTGVTTFCAKGPRTKGTIWFVKTKLPLEGSCHVLRPVASDTRTRLIPSWVFANLNCPATSSAWVAVAPVPIDTPVLVVELTSVELKLTVCSVGVRVTVAVLGPTVDVWLVVPPFCVSTEADWSGLEILAELASLANVIPTVFST